jgi:dihydroxyacetone kinase-like protein
MQKILNRADTFVDDMLDGVIRAHPDCLRLVGPRAVVRSDAPTGRVAIATGGGSGHLPVFLGYVGRGLVDGCAVGDVFASPSAQTMLEVIRAVNGEAGVLLLYGNYGGDVMNFDLAAEMAADDGIDVVTVLAADDVASAPRAERARRRGIAGISLLYKLAGARAEQGASLAEVAATVEAAAANLGSMGVALAPCTIPAAGHPTFELPNGEMEVGMGIHGEPGVRRGKLGTAAEIATELTDAIAQDLALQALDEVAVVVNGLGATPREELYILYREAAKALDALNVKVYRTWIGEYATSLEMAGSSLSFLRVDEERKALLAAPSSTPFVGW